MFNKKLIALLTYILVINSTLACGYEFPNSFINGDRIGRHTLMSNHYLLLGDYFYPKMKENKFKSSFLTTSYGDIIDFERFLLTTDLTEQKQIVLVDQYTVYAKACRVGEDADFNCKVDGSAEFILYLEGVKALKQNKGEVTFPKSWLKILELPKSERQYRTIWVQYMAGNLAKTDLDRVNNYEKVRESAKAGYVDTLGLAYESYNSSFKYVKDPVLSLTEGLKAYSFYSLVEDYKRSSMIKDGLELQLRTKKSEIYLKWADNPICREMMIGWANACERHYYLSLGGKLCYDILKTLKGKELKSAGLLAMVAYDNGKYTKAIELLELAKDDDLLAIWVNAKLARRNGDLESENKHLKNWLKIYLNRSKNSTSLDYNKTVVLNEKVYGQLGLINIEQGDFLAALHAFVKSGAKLDACGVAENLLTIENLKKYVDQYCTSFLENPQSKRDDYYIDRDIKEILCKILSARYFRNHEFDQAIAYASNAIKPLIITYRDLMKRSKNNTTSRDERALALFNAAKILRWQGIEVAGTMLLPDNGLFLGKYRSGTLNEDCYKKFNLNEEVLALVNARPTKRFHYRYVAADMMWQVVKLADSKELKAMASFCGGKFIAARSSKEANKFYQSLVKLKAGELSTVADASRWFPKQTSKALSNAYKSTDPISLETINRLINTEAFSTEYYLKLQKAREKKARAKVNPLR